MLSSVASGRCFCLLPLIVSSSHAILACKETVIEDEHGNEQEDEDEHKGEGGRHRPWTE